MKNNILIFGEVLFDDFGEQNKVLGGASFNVAWHLKGLDFNLLFVSKVGIDKEGNTVLEHMQNWGMNILGVQKDPDHPTGIVQVKISDNEPSFEILANQAYDFVDDEKIKQLLSTQKIDIVYHGTLAIRNQQSRKALDQIISSTQAKVFLDVNLRDPWWKEDLLIKSIARCNFLKCNIAELKVISKIVRVSGSPEEIAQQLHKKYDLEMAIITLGADGAFIVDRLGNVIRQQSKPVTNLIDTVGAGDGFSVVTLIGIILDWPYKLLLRHATDFASQICRIRGATIANKRFYNMTQNKWKNKSQ